MYHFATFGTGWSSKDFTIPIFPLESRTPEFLASCLGQGVSAGVGYYRAASGLGDLFSTELYFPEQKLDA